MKMEATSLTMSRRMTASIRRTSSTKLCSSSRALLMFTEQSHDGIRGCLKGGSGKAQFETLRAELQASLGQLQGRPGGNGDQGALLLQSMRLDVLKFSRVDPESWILAINEYFSLLNTLDDQRLQIMGVNLEGADAKCESFFVSRPTTLGDAFSLALITEARLDDQEALVAGTTAKTFGNNGGDESESSGPITPTEEDDQSFVDEESYLYGQILDKTSMVHMDDFCINEDQHGSVRSIGVAINSDVADLAARFRTAGVREYMSFGNRPLCLISKLLCGLKKNPCLFTEDYRIPESRYFFRHHLEDKVDVKEWEMIHP
ncbi:hypothetical protein Tco_1500572 [Tanacetum coccineum]